MPSSTSSSRVEGAGYSTRCNLRDNVAAYPNLGGTMHSIASKLLGLFANPVTHALIVSLTSAEVADMIQLILIVVVVVTKNTYQHGN